MVLTIPSLEIARSVCEYISVRKTVPERSTAIPPGKYKRATASGPST